mgnify:CR=1 FL=1
MTYLGGAGHRWEVMCGRVVYNDTVRHARKMATLKALGSCSGPSCVRRHGMTLFDLARIAARHTTQMAMAMRRALMERGVDVDALAYAERRYGGVAECMRNVVSPVDLRTARANGARMAFL